MSSLGELQHLVLLALLRLGNEAYGVAIRDEIRDIADRDLTLGAIYSALRRLEAQGFITARIGTPEPIVGGRAKTFFMLTPAGLRAVRAAQQQLARMLEGIPGLPLSHREGEAT